MLRLPQTFLGTSTFGDGIPLRFGQLLQPDQLQPGAGQRGAHLVAHDREELTLGPVRQLRPLRGGLGLRLARAVPESNGQAANVCGDGVVAEGEACDEGAETFFCDFDCTLASCGDG